jgi:hypothetical protein
VARSRVRPRTPVGLAALVAILVAAAPAAQAAPSLASYRGFATWIDIYSPQAWSDPEGTVAAVAARGVRTLFLETGNYRQSTDLVRRAGLSRLVEAAHAAGLRVVAWYLPSFTRPARDLRRSLAAASFRTNSGQRFDSFALDIESSAVKPVSRRTARLLTLSRDLRTAVGARYPLGAIIPSPRGMELRPSFWPGFPFRRLAAIYDVFVPMAYYTYHVHGEQTVRDDVARAISLIRVKTGDPEIPIHVIGGLGDDSTRADVRGFMRAVAACRPIGYGLYDYFATKPAAWKLLASPPELSNEPC